MLTGKITPLFPCRILCSFDLSFRNNSRCAAEPVQQQHYAIYYSAYSATYCQSSHSLFWHTWRTSLVFESSCTVGLIQSNTSELRGTSFRSTYLQFEFSFLYSIQSFVATYQTAVPADDYMVYQLMITWCATYRHAQMWTSCIPNSTHVTLYVYYVIAHSSKVHKWIPDSWDSSRANQRFCCDG
jgi:hypothetical protein